MHLTKTVHVSLKSNELKSKMQKFQNKTGNDYMEHQHYDSYTKHTLKSQLKAVSHCFTAIKQWNVL